MNIVGDIARGLTSSLGCLAAAIGVSLIGMKAVEKVGRNPSASAIILVQANSGTASAQAVASYSLFLYQG
ncbi:MAG: ATPase [Opitutales bacterium]|nr:ATPase [Opitutales bacterium]